MTLYNKHIRRDIGRKRERKGVYYHVSSRICIYKCNEGEESTYMSKSPNIKKAKEKRRRARELPLPRTAESLVEREGSGFREREGRNP